MVSEYEADLYSIGNTAVIVTDGFAFRATNDACVKEKDGRLVATKFGLERVGPSTVRRTREEASEYGKEMYDRINKKIKLVLYYGDKYYIPTTIDRVFPDQNDYAVYDTETEKIYRVKTDDINKDIYNLVGVDDRTIKKVSISNLRSGLNSQYIPLVGIKNNI